MTAEDANSSITCAVMIESAAALMAIEEIAAVPGVGQLFIGPYDLSLSLGTTVPALLDDDSDASPLTRIVQTAASYGHSVGGFAGTPEIAERFRERGITCVAVATDLWITAEARAALVEQSLSAVPSGSARTGCTVSLSKRALRRAQGT
jgi:2-keto-3-deoxy-L-rhamnonate aldolase RhmA